MYNVSHTRTSQRPFHRLLHFLFLLKFPHACPKPFSVARHLCSLYHARNKQRVILKGERPPLQKEWPECLRVLLASAWSPDLTARPTAEEVVVALRAIKADLPAARRRQSLPLKRRSSSQQTRASSASTFLSCDRDRDGDDHGEMLGISPVYAPAKSRFSFSLDGPPSQRKYKRSPALAKCSSQDTGRTRRCSFKSISSKGKGSGNGGTGPGRTDGTGGKNRLSRAASMRQDHLVQPKDTAPLSTGATLGAADGDGGTHGSRGSGSSNRSSAPCACTNCSLLQDKSALGNVRDAIVAALARCAAAQNPSQPLAAAAVGGGCDDTDSISSVTEAAGVSVASDEKQCMNTDCGLEDSRCPRREDPRSAPSSGEQVNDLRGSSRTSSLKKLWPKASPVASPPLSSISAPNPTILTCNSSSNVSTADGDTSVSSDQGKVAANVQEGGKLLDRWPHEDSGDSVSVKALVLAFEESQLLSSSKVNSLRKMAANRGPSPTSECFHSAVSVRAYAACILSMEIRGNLTVQDSDRFHCLHKMECARPKGLMRVACRSGQPRAPSLATMLPK